jgi:hypothetical protein
MWPDLVQKSKDGGLDVIETYLFWNLHEPVRNQVCFFTLKFCFCSLERKCMKIFNDRTLNDFTL